MTDAAHEWPLGKRVLEARGEESQRSVAQRAGVSPELLWQVENGRRRDGQVSKPKQDTIEKIARALDIPVAEALALAGYNPERAAPPADGLEAALARKVAKLDPREVRALEILVDSILLSRGQLSAGAAQPDVMVRSAGEDVLTEVQSHGESVEKAKRSRQKQDD